MDAYLESSDSITPHVNNGTMISWCPAAPLSRPLHDVYTRTVVPLHVEIARRESGRLPRVEISRDRQSLEKNFRHYHRAAQVEDDTAIV
jgi:hypothetical protein